MYVSLVCLNLKPHKPVIPAQGVAGVSHSMLCACVTVGLCKSQRALQGGIHCKKSFKVKVDFRLRGNDGG